MQLKYSYQPSKAVKGRGRRRTPERWRSGPDPYQHELYYAWHKHRSQANYRGEPYELTFEDWQVIWANPEDFLNRGRKPDNLTLTRIDPEGAWSTDNVIIMTRLEHLRKEIKRRELRKQ